MRILITGNMGYIGPVLNRELRNHFPDAEVWGFDSGYFAHCLTNAILDVPAHTKESTVTVLHALRFANSPVASRGLNVNE